ncbi:hypothetical protein [Hazenella coriacea]|uniref:Uncharacterized protein n=1 Tax=Hazenella coriacea TaxID=1179467 RepID=A0A4R3L784_9BACL|nr:hypothetical protein [Hazenella coriacea]TCS95791.1 hypothetical protein EDD58_102372 [Hazenella coriacea]
MQRLLVILLIVLILILLIPRYERIGEAILRLLKLDDSKRGKDDEQ